MKRFKRAVCAAALVLGLGAANAEAALIVLGDGNVATDLPFGAFDNRQWFLNVLGGGNTVLLTPSSVDNFANDINNFYNSVAGVTSSILAGAVTAASLTGVELFISPATLHDYTPAEIAVLGAFLAGGGSVMLMAEHNGFLPQTAIVNSVLAGLGSGISVVPAFELCGLNVLSGAQIAAHPLNAGIDQMQMGCTSQVLGGTALFLTRPGFVMAAIEGEQSVIPEPATLSLLGLGLAVAARRLRRRQA